MPMQAMSSGVIIAVLWAALRFLFGGWFIFFAGFMLIRFGGHVPGSTGLDANPFLGALNKAGFVEPALMVVYILGGCAMLFPRSAPLGIVFLAGPVIMIFCFHLFDTGLILWGSIWPIGLSALAWHFRNGLAPLWNYTAAN